jgi:hypothetical protein
MNKKILYFLVLLQSNFLAQDNSTEKFVVGKDYSFSTDSNKYKIYKLIESYNQVFFDENINFSHYWTKRTTDTYVKPDNGLRLQLNYYTSPKFTYILDVLHIYKKEDYWIVQIGFNVFTKDNLFKGLIAIYNYGVEFENNTPKFFPLIEKFPLIQIIKKDFSLYLDNKIEDNQFNSDSVQDYRNKLSTFFKFDLPHFRCYQFMDNSKIYEGTGFTVKYSTPDQIYEYYDAYNRIVYVLSYKSFKHELVHAYLVEKFGGNCHHWFNEGCATFLGGSGTLDLNQHLKILSFFLKNHPEINLNNLLDYQAIIIDKQTSCKYAIGGLICKLAFEKHGSDGLNKLLNFGSSDLNFYNAITSLFGVKQENLNEFLRKELEKF